MRVLHGIGVGSSVAVGRVLRMPDPLPEPARTPRTADADTESAAVVAAVASVVADLSARGAQAGRAAQAVLEAQAMMAQDPELVRDIDARIDAGNTAERAVFEAFTAYQQLLTGLGGRVAERAVDLHDVGQRVITALRGAQPPRVPVSDTPFVLVAGELAPADTALLDPAMVLAIVTRGGGPTSHTAILARAKAITAVVGTAGADALADGETVLVDAASGTVTVDPDDAMIAAASARRVARPAPADAGALADGVMIPLLANLGSVADVAAALELGAEGVGLLRTEFLFPDGDTAPTIEQQLARYTEVLDAFGGKKVVVRCLDAGADKPLRFLNQTPVANPALGLRGLRVLRANEAVLHDQLAALAEAQQATAAELWVMAPMVTDLEETEYFVGLAKRLGIRVAGVMAEVPALALMADGVAAASDFISIGTNDLTQYTLAADRMLGAVASYQDPWHPAVLRLVKMLGDAGRASGTPVGVCGEAAADPLLAVVLVGLGATSLSMAPVALAGVRAELSRHTRPQAEALATAALAAPTASAARAAALSLR